MMCEESVKHFQEKMLKAIVLEYLTERLLHKLNNIICIAKTNIEVMAMQCLKSDSRIDQETVLETRNAMIRYDSILKAFSYFARTDTHDKAGCELFTGFFQFSQLLKEGLIRDISISIKRESIIYCRPEFVTGVVLQTLYLLLNLGALDKDKKPVDINVFENEGYIGIRLKGYFNQNTINKISLSITNALSMDEPLLALWVDNLKRKKAIFDFKKVEDAIEIDISIPFERCDNGQKA